MRIAFIKPAIGRQAGGRYVDEGRMEPLQLGLLANLTPDDVQILFWDDRCEEIDFSADIGLAALTVETFTARRSYEICDGFRARGTAVVLGGMHPTLLPDEASQHADSVVVGDAEDIWGTVVEDARSSSLKPFYRSTHVNPQHGGTVPRRDMFKGKGYKPLSLVQFGRGCTHPCNYCVINTYFEQRHTVRPVEEVIEEIIRLDRKLVFFVDDNLTMDREAAKELFRSLIPLKIKWVGQGSIDMVEDPELMELMARSGCLGHVIGFESIDPEGLQAMRKSPNLRGFDRYESAVKVLKDHNFQTWAAFILGHDEDTESGIYLTLDFALRHKFPFAAFNILMPYPGTSVYSKLEAEGRLLFDGRWWLHPDYMFNHAAFIPKHMPPETLTRVTFDVRRKWNSWGSIWNRFLDPKTNMSSIFRMALYWKYNPLFRRETLVKQGIRLGLS